jgi:cytochrome c-type biogenesis protein CcmH
VYWEQLKATLPPDSDIARSIGASIAEARDLGKIGAGAVPPASPAAAMATAKQAPAPAASAPAAPAPAKAASAAIPGAAVSGEVKLAPALAKGASPNDAVFVIARAAEGPKMPLAIVRKQVKDLPFTFALDDSLAMSPEMKISNFAEIVVTARISKTGNAMPTAGDLEGSSKPIRIGTQGVSVVIDGTRP